MIRPSDLRSNFPSEADAVPSVEIRDTEAGRKTRRSDTVVPTETVPRPHAMSASHISPVALIDRAGALSRMGNDLELLQDMAAMFIRDVPRLLTTLRDALAIGDADEAARAAHSIKGLAANFGAAPCVAAALAIESPAKAGQLGSLAGPQSRLAEQVELLCGALQREVLS